MAFKNVIHARLAGVVALAYPEVLYQGFGNVNGILEARGGDYAPLLLLQIVAAKILTTSVCQRSGLVGGVYAPSIFMGAQHAHQAPRCCLLICPKAPPLQFSCACTK